MKIRVLEKSFSILEAVVISSPNPMRVSELSDKFDLNNSTCSRIIRDLVNLGYLKQVSRHEGYTVGPRLVTLGLLTDYKNDLLEAARPLVDKISCENEASVLISERVDDVRYILYHHNECSKIVIDLGQLANRDLTFTASGLLLTAYASKKEQANILKNYNTTMEKIKGGTIDFEKIRRDKEVVFSQTGSNQGVCAFPVFKNGEMIAAFAGSMHVEDFVGEKKEKFIKDLSEAAENITLKITTQTTAG